MDKQEIFDSMLLYINKDVFLNTGKKILPEEQLEKLSELIDICSENVLNHYAGILTRAAGSEKIKKEDIMKKNDEKSAPYVSVMKMITSVPELEALYVKIAKKKLSEARKQRFLKPAVISGVIGIFAAFVMASGSGFLAAVILFLDLAAFLLQVI